MRIIKEGKPHILKECLDFAIVSCNDFRLKSSYNEMNSPYYEELKLFYNSIKSQSLLNDEEKTFFKYYSSYSCCLAQLLFYSFTSLCDITSLDCVSDLTANFNKYSLEKFPVFSLSPFGLSLVENTEQPFIKTIQSLNLSEKEQLSLIYAFYNYEEDIKKILEILKRFENLILSSSLYQNNELFLLNDFDDNTISDYFTKSDNPILNDMIDDDISIHVYPSICYFESFSLFIDNFNIVYLYFGIGRKADYLYLQLPEQRKTDIIDFLSALSDPTKLEILKRIKSKARYGQELAEILKLKTPTISYHMDTLAQINLVKIERKQKRLYYSLNKDEIEKMIEATKEYLL